MVTRQFDQWLLLFILLPAVLLPESAFAAPRQPRVLVLHSTRQDAELARLADRDLPRVIGTQLSQMIDYYAEYMDSARISLPRRETAFRNLLQQKYRGKRFDLVIAIQDPAWQFVRRHGNTLFPRTPVVFASAVPNVPRQRNSTGVIAGLNLRETVDLALTLQPDVRRIYVVSGASPRDQVYENLARTQLRSLERRVSITYLAGLPRAELERRVAALPERSIVYYLIVYQDGNGENLNPLDFLHRLAQLSNRPTYSWVDSAMDRGIVGGQLRDQSALVQAVAAKSIRVLRGEVPRRIPISTIDLNVPQVDWRQLQRWRISEARVPSGTRIAYRQPEPVTRGKAYVWTAVPLSLVVVLAAAWTMQRRRRRGVPVDDLRSVLDAARVEERTRHLTRRLIEAQEDEWTRIALELHDDIGQQAALLAMDLQRAIAAARGRQRGTKRFVQEALLRAKTLSRSARDLSHQLYPSALRLVGLVGALAELQRDHSGSGTSITVSADQVIPTLPDEIALCLFRVAQEGIHNAIKHSGARNIRIRLSGENDQVMLTVVDDGCGFDVAAASGKGLGLLSMNERVGAVGGALHIASAEQGGTRLEVSVPLRSVRPSTTKLAC
jgi:signal transduction histidine kinase